MSDDWKPGDVAWCIKRTHHIIPGVAERIRVGAAYTVVKVGRPVAELDGERALGFAEVKPRARNCGYPETLFRKITPGTEIKGAEVERERFKQGNPWKVPA